jgi:hypothetical protein
VGVATVFLKPLLGLSDKQGILVVAGIRVAAGLLLIANVLVGRARMLRLIADSARQSSSPPPEPAPKKDLDELWGRITP